MIRKLNFRPWIFAVYLLVAALPPQARAATDEKILTQEDIVREFASGTLNLNALRRQGLQVFTTPFTASDGYGDGPFDPAETPPTALGHRPTLQGNGLSLRVNGLDAQSCNECHSFVSMATRPPKLGIGGVGGLVNNALIGPSLIDVADSSDDRVQYVSGHDPDLQLLADGVADFNGRYVNPPFLFGGGGVELLGKEMTADLQRLLKKARNSPAGTVTSLDTHGVHFGHITTVNNLGDVELDVEGIGPTNIADLLPEEVLVVRPFGRKGENFSMRDFDRTAMQFHLGIQPVEVVGYNIDEDGDGVVNEVTIAEMSALHIFDVTNPRPIMERLDSDAEAGFRTFREIGCANCHRPYLKTTSRFLPLAYPEVATDPSQNVYIRIDLTRVGFDPVPGEDGVFVPLFADLKRHDMGPGLEESLEHAGSANREFTTARLWGVADTAPYLHDGRATTLHDAITMHGGEALDARNRFLQLPAEGQAKLLDFLKKLRTPANPNQELLTEFPGHHT